MRSNDSASVLIVDDEALHRDFAACVLGPAGWRVIAVASGEEALDVLDTRPPPALILMDLHLQGMSGPDTVAAIRRRDRPASALPIIACTTTRLDNPDALRLRGFDGFLAKPFTSDELRAAADRWRPDDAGGTLDRLEATLDPAQIRSMTIRFGTLLEEALAARDDATTQEMAHRIAGIAGTLGFAAVGRAWLAWSEGDVAAREPARREARRALAAIANRHSNEAD